MSSQLQQAKALLNQKNSDPEKALLLLQKEMNTQGQTTELLYLMVKGFLAKKDYNSAINVLTALRNRGNTDARLFYQLALCYSKKEENGKAIEHASLALNEEQGYTPAWILLGEIFHGQSKLNDALKFYQKANQFDPSNEEIAYKIGTIYYEQGYYEKAIELFDIAIKQHAKFEKAYQRKAEAQLNNKQPDEAIETIYEVLEINPAFMAAHNVLGNIYKKTGKFGKALNYYKLLIEKYPKELSVHANYANMLLDGGEYKKAQKHYNIVLNRAPNEKVVHSNMLMGLHYDPDNTKEEIFEAHLKWDQLHTPGKRLSRPVPSNQDKDKKLRIGLISAGLWKHPVGWMITAGLENLSKDRFEIYCYSTDNRIDDIAKRIHHTSSAWKKVDGYSDEVIANIIKEDEIDILVELSGHSSGGKLSAVAHEPAPVMVKWVGGLFNTTGMKAMDYLLTDHFETPAGEEEFYTEKMVRMPDDYICFTPPDYDIEVGELPYTKTGYITFGCFNNPKKINEAVLENWAKILQKFPDSKLFLKGSQYDADTMRDRIIHILGSFDISESRIMFEGHSAHNELLESYNRVDIALDPWPYSGGLTTCEALWMGVPVITRPGPTFAGRHSTTHLNNAGFPEWVANSWEEYIEKVVELASDTDKLSELRSGMREKIEASPLCNGEQFGKNLSKALREMWNQRVEGYRKELPEGEWQQHIEVKDLDEENFNDTMPHSQVADEEMVFTPPILAEAENVDKKAKPEVMKDGKNTFLIEKTALNGHATENATPTEIIKVTLKDHFVENKPIGFEIPRAEVFRVKNIFSQNEYSLPKGFKVKNGGVIVDVGANVGTFALYAKQWNQKSRIYCFEPNPQVFPLLETNTKGFTGIETNFFALGDEEGTLVLTQHPRNTGESSTSRAIKGGKKVDVNVHISGEVLKERGIKEIEVLKIDTEGAEVSILKGMKQYLPHIKVVMLEYHSENDRRILDNMLDDFVLYSADIPGFAGIGTVKYVNKKILTKK